MPAHLRPLGFALIIAVCIAIPSVASASPRIIGGSEVDAPKHAAAWPSIVALTMKGWPALRGQFCAGTLVAPTLVVTAAHCVHQPEGGQVLPEQIEALTGIRNLSDESTSQRISVSQIYVHPGYKEKLDNDIAVIRLSQPSASPTMAVAPVAPVAGTAVSIAGWGALTPEVSRFPETLHEGTVPVMDRSVCASLYLYERTQVIPGMLCAGALNTAGDFPANNGIDSCNGDSGGPLVSQGLLAGIVSWGRECASRTLPGVYTDAAFYAGWLARISPASGGADGLTAPTRVRSAAPAASSLDIAWDPVAGASGYAVSVIMRGRLDEYTPAIYSLRTGATHIKVKQLWPQQPYLVRVVSLAADASPGDASETVLMRTTKDVTRPTRPGRPVVIRRNQRAVFVNWTPATDDVIVSEYLVQIRDPARSMRWRTGAITHRRAQGLYPLLPQRHYQVRVIARDAAGYLSLPGPIATISTR